LCGSPLGGERHPAIEQRFEKKDRKAEPKPDGCEGHRSRPTTV
jgi:hypothetical protein